MIGLVNTQKYPSPTKTICPICQADIVLYTHNRALSLACSNCSAISNYTYTRGLKFDTQLSYKGRLKPTFKVGDVFNIDDAKYRLINLVIKEELTYRTQWVEYTLFHPVIGSIVLNESDGHFNLLKPTQIYGDSVGKNMKLETERGEETFQLYTKYKFKIRYAEGEFILDNLKDQNVACADYVSSPYILSHEKSKDEDCWFLGEYCEHSKVKSWLTKSVDMPVKEGIAPNQPFALNFKHDSLIRLSVIAFITVVIIQFILSTFIHRNQIVSNQTFLHSDSLRTRVYVSQPFTIHKDGVASDFIISAPLSNNWVEANFTLVNETNGDQYYFGQALEYYYGVTEGESWSEGSKEETVTVGNLKKGQYHYNVEVTTDGYKRFDSVSVMVIEDVSLISNCLILLLCIIIFPVIIHFRKKSFDRRQWYNSEYSPYNYEN